MKYSRLILLMVSLILLCGFSSQPMDEKQAQTMFPTSKHKLWEELAKCKVKYDNKKGTVSVDLTSEVKSLEGKEIEISGFMLPLEATEKFKHFILSKRTPTCPFCMPGEPNEVIEVFSKKEMKWEEKMITLKGTFTIGNQKENGLIFQMKEAQITD